MDAETERTKIETTNPVEHGNYVIRGKAADLFRAVSGVRVDLQIAKRMILLCVDHPDDDEDQTEADTEEALWTAALIRFRRAFATGRNVDWGHSSLLGSLPLDLRRAHGRFLMFADKFIAHATGIGEDLTVTAVLGPVTGGSVAVYGGTVRKSRVTSLGTDLAQEFATLLTALEEAVTAREVRAHQEFLEEIRTWTPDALLREGKYSESVHFDETSRLYRNMLAKYDRA